METRKYKERTTEKGIYTKNRIRKRKSKRNGGNMKRKKKREEEKNRKN